MLQWFEWIWTLEDGEEQTRRSIQLGDRGHGDGEDTDDVLGKERVVIERMALLFLQPPGWTGPVGFVYEHPPILLRPNKGARHQH